MPDFERIRKRLASPEDVKPPGLFSFGTSWYGGPQFTDPFSSRRAPSPWQLVENYNSLIYAMVGKNRDAISRLPLRLYADGSRAQGGKPRSACDPIRVSRHVGTRLARAGMVSSSAVDQVYEVRNHPFLNCLDRPDPWGYFDRAKLIGFMVASGDVIGWSLLTPEGNGWDWRKEDAKPFGPPEYLWALYAQYTIPVRYPQSPLIKYFQYFADRIPFAACLWYRQTVSLRDAYAGAFSPTYAGETYRMVEQEEVQVLSQVLSLGPRPNIIASPKDPNWIPGEAERKRHEQDMNRRQSGGNAGKILVANGSYEYTPVSYSPADMGGKEFAEYAMYVLAPIFGQPPTFYTVDSNLANLQAAKREHAEFGIEPRCRALEGTFNNLIKQWDERLFVRFDPPLEEDEVARQQVVDMQLKSGQVTINQANEELKWPPVAWGDEPWLPQTLQQPSMLQATHEQTIQQMQAGTDSMGKNDELAEDGQKHDQKLEKDQHKLAKDQFAEQKKQNAKDIKDDKERSVGPDIEELCRSVLTMIQGMAQ